MGMNPVAIAESATAGIIAAIVAEEMAKHVASDKNAPLMVEALIQIRDLLSNINAKYIHDEQEDQYEFIQFDKSNQRLVNLHGYDHMLVFVPVTTIFNVTFGNLGSFLYTPPLGWNTLDFPELTVLKLDATNTSATQGIYMRLTNKETSIV